MQGIVLTIFAQKGILKMCFSSHCRCQRGVTDKSILQKTHNNLIAVFFSQTDMVTSGLNQNLSNVQDDSSKTVSLGQEALHWIAGLLSSQAVWISPKDRKRIGCQRYEYPDI